MNTKKILFISIILMISVIYFCPLKAQTDDITTEDWIVQGLTSARLGEHDDACTFYDKALEIDPESILALCYKGDSLVEQQKYEEGMKCYDSALEINPYLCLFCCLSYL